MELFSIRIQRTFQLVSTIKVNTEYVKNQKYHVYKRIEKVYNNPHPGSGVV